MQQSQRATQPMSVVTDREEDVRAKTKDGNGDDRQNTAAERQSLKERQLEHR